MTMTPNWNNVNDVTVTPHDRRGYHCCGNASVMTSNDHFCNSCSSDVSSHHITPLASRHLTPALSRHMTPVPSRHVTPMTLFSTAVSLMIATIMTVCAESGSAIQMALQPGTFILNEHQTANIVCEFVAENFSLFHNPIVWRKRQEAEDCQVNMMGNLQEPFASTQRYKVTYDPQPPLYIFKLTITDLSAEDSGNYSCEVSGPQNSVKASLQHQLFVRARVDYLQLHTGNSSDLLSLQNPLILVEHYPTTLKCTAVGGYPPPELDIYIGNSSGEGTLSTNDLEISRKMSLSGRRGLRLMQYTTERTVGRFVARAEDDGREVRCTASVSGLATKQTRTNIVVQHGAIIHCDRTEVMLGERNVNLRCTVRVRPAFTSLYWIIDDNGTTVSEGEVVNEYWILVLDLGEDIYETQLFLRLVSSRSFRTYTLFVENSVARRHYDVMLNYKTLSAVKQDIKRKVGKDASKQEEAAHQTAISHHRSIAVSHVTAFDQWTSSLLVTCFIIGLTFTVASSSSV